MAVSVAAQEPTQASIRALLRQLHDGTPTGLEYEDQGEGKELAWIDGEEPCSRRPAGVEPGVEPASGASVRSEPPPSVAYLLPGLPPEGSGGSHSLIQEARGLRELGAPARVCVPEESLQTVEALYGNEDDLFATYRDEPTALALDVASVLDVVAPADVVVATEYPSVGSLMRLAHTRPGIVCAYYVQDYEPLFAMPETSRSDRALLSYRAIADQLLFAKTHWLRGIVGELHGVPVAKVRPSLDLELFHTRGRLESARRLRVAAMIRPRTPRRRPAATLNALAAIDGSLGEAAELITFGCDEDSFAQLADHAVPAVDHLGLLSRRGVSELMRRCDMFIDASAYQAFGRTGLEAMACGAVPVLPALGGVYEYAVEDENAVILADGGAETIADAVVGLGLDRPKLESMKRAGVLAAQGFSIERAARSQLDIFSAALRDRRLSCTVPAS
jgi:glycosyltransferase involved in cell wall biosynthesis